MALSASGQTSLLLTAADGLTSSLVNFVYEDRYGLIWIGTEDGLNKYDGVKLTAYRHVKSDKSSLANNYVSTMIEDAQGRLIVSTHNGMQLYRHDTDDFSPQATFADGEVMHENVSRMMLEHDGRLYGTGDLNCEVKVRDRDHLEIVPMAKPYFADEISKELTLELNVRTTLRYDDRHLLLGTDGQGVKLYDEKLHTYTNYSLDIPGIPRELQKVHHLMRDRSGNLWAALYQKGVVMMSQHRSMFGYIGARTALHNKIGAHCVQSIFRSSDGGMWVGTDGDGLYYLKDEDAIHYTSGVPPIINTVMEDSEGTLWIGSYGYPCYRGANGVFKEVDGLPEYPRVFTIKEDRQRRIWLGTMYNGLYCYDMNSGHVEHADFEGMNRFINCLYILSNGDVLAGTYNGIYNITRHENQLARQIVYAMYEDARGRLWVGTAEGLILLDKGREKTYTISDGMSSNMVFAICEDERDRKWLSSNHGLMCFDEHKGVFTNYSVSDGLQGNEFSKGAALKDVDGTLWFAGHEGITYFTPTNISQFQYELHPRISAFYINSVCVNARTQTGGKPVISSALYDAREFSLAYEDNSFSVEMSTIEIDCPAGSIFIYALDDGEWVSIPGGGHLVTFSNLSAGQHKLRFAVEYDGKRSGTEEICIEIRHPWWGSIWMKCFLVLIFITISTLFFFWIRSKEKVKALALISHKIRTPMSLIISPLVQLLESDPDEQRQRMYKLMLRNAEKLQHLAAQATEAEPIGPISDVRLEEPITANKHKSSTPRQLIIVEDDEEVLKYLSEQLSSEYHVREARNGKEALELIFKKMPDAIISDVTMPEMDGITLCHKLKKNIHLAHIPIILLTARADEESTLQGLGIGADAYITKPFNTKILRQCLSNLIQLRQQLKNTYQDQQLQEDKLKELEVVNYEDQFMERLMDCINRHISQQDFTIEMLCEEIGISRVHLHRRIKKRTNQSTSIFIRNVRLRLAEKLLRESDMSISQVAERIGFTSLPHFSKAFKEEYGVSPIEWRERNRVQP